MGQLSAAKAASGWKLQRRDGCSRSGLPSLDGLGSYAAATEFDKHFATMGDAGVNDYTAARAWRAFQTADSWSAS